MIGDAIVYYKEKLSKDNFTVFMKNFHKNYVKENQKIDPKKFNFIFHGSKNTEYLRYLKMSIHHQSSEINFLFKKQKKRNLMV